MAQAIPIVIAVIAAAASAYGSYQQSQSLRRQAEAEETAAEVARQEGQAAVYRAQADTLEISRRQRAILGRQAALYGYAGVEMTGSPLDVMAETAANAQRDITYRGYAGDMQMRAKGYEAQLHEWRAENLKDQASNELTMGLLVKAPMAGASSYFGAGGSTGGLFGGSETPTTSVPMSSASLDEMGSSWLKSGKVNNPDPDLINNWRMNSLWGSASPY